MSDKSFARVMQLSRRPDGSIAERDTSPDEVTRIQIDQAIDALKDTLRILERLNGRLRRAGHR